MRPGEGLGDTCLVCGINDASVLNIVSRGVDGRRQFNTVCDTHLNGQWWLAWKKVDINTPNTNKVSAVPDEPDYKQLFVDLFRQVGACEAPEGTQIDDVLENFQNAYDDATGSATEPAWGFRP